MAIKRISDLDSILNEGGEYEHVVLPVESGVKRDVLGGYTSREHGRETQQLLGSKFEISWLKDGDQNYTKYESRSIEYPTLCAYITHNIQCEDYPFYGNKTLNGDLSVFGNVNVEGDNFYVNSKNVNLSGDNVNVKGDKVLVDGRQTYIYGHDFINLSVVNNTTNVLGLSGDNIALYGKQTLDLIYDKELRICWRNGTEIIPVMTFGHANNKPTVAFNESNDRGINESNPIKGTITHSLWS